MRQEKEMLFFAALAFVIVGFTTSVINEAIGAIAGGLSNGYFPPLDPLLPRVGDSYGSGYFGASRDGGRRKHMGQDYLSSPGQSVFSPVSGIVKKVGPAYASGESGWLKMVTIETSFGAKVNIMYVLPWAVEVGQKVTRGQLLGNAQDLTKKYPGIKNHIHLEVLMFGLHVDPVDFFKIKTA